MTFLYRAPRKICRTRIALVPYEAGDSVFHCLGQTSSKLLERCGLAGREKGGAYGLLQMQWVDVQGELFRSLFGYPRFSRLALSCLWTDPRPTDFVQSYPPPCAAQGGREPEPQIHGKKGISTEEKFDEGLK
jgi:hypothetical protein